MTDDIVEAVLADYQEAMVEHLLVELPPDELRRRLLADPRVFPFRAYVESFDLRLLEVTALLMRGWAKRRT
jgi:hypothetical protein